MSGGAPLPWLAQPLADALAGLRGHAVLVHGPDGVGQFEFAWALAQAWLCETARAPGSLGCGECTGCRWMAARAHPDALALLPEAERLRREWPGSEAEADGKKARPSRDVKVEAVRAAIAWTQHTSSRGRGKVVLIQPAQAMNAIAANALLKTLEEPPAGVRLLLCCADPQALLPTVRSRCQLWPLATPPAEQAAAWLAQQGLAQPGVLLAAAGGRPLLAAAMAADGLDAAAWAALPAAVARGDARGLASLPVPLLVDALQKLCHDALALAVGAAPRFFPAERVPAALGVAPLAAWSRELARVARHDEHPWNGPLLAEALIAEGARCWPPAQAGRVATLGAR